MGKCKVCETETDTELCTNCWEVEKRIDQYLTSEKGRFTILEKIKEKYRDDGDVFFNPKKFCNSEITCSECGECDERN